jgi:hypothetical protein
MTVVLLLMASYIIILIITSCGKSGGGGNPVNGGGDPGENGTPTDSLIGGGEGDSAKTDADTAGIGGNPPPDTVKTDDPGTDPGDGGKTSDTTQTGGNPPQDTVKTDNPGTDPGNGGKTSDTTQTGGNPPPDDPVIDPPTQPTRHKVAMRKIGDGKITINCEDWQNVRNRIHSYMTACETVVGDPTGKVSDSAHYAYAETGEKLTIPYFRSNFNDPDLDTAHVIDSVKVGNETEGWKTYPLPPLPKNMPYDWDRSNQVFYFTTDEIRSDVEILFYTRKMLIVEILLPFPDGKLPTENGGVSPVLKSCGFGATPDSYKVRMVVNLIALRTNKPIRGQITYRNYVDGLIELRTANDVRFNNPNRNGSYVHIYRLPMTTNLSNSYLNNGFYNNQFILDATLSFRDSIGQESNKSITWDIDFDSEPITVQIPDGYTIGYKLINDPCAPIRNTIGTGYYIERLYDELYGN